MNLEVLFSITCRCMILNSQAVVKQQASRVFEAVMFCGFFFQDENMLLEIHVHIWC